MVKPGEFPTGIAFKKMIHKRAATYTERHEDQGKAYEELYRTMLWVAANFTTAENSNSELAVSDMEFYLSGVRNKFAKPASAP